MREAGGTEKAMSDVKIQGSFDARFERVREMNPMHMGAWLVNPRPRRLLAAAYDCL